VTLHLDLRDVGVAVHRRDDRVEDVVRRLEITALLY